MYQLEDIKENRKNEEFKMNDEEYNKMKLTQTQITELEERTKTLRTIRILAIIISIGALITFAFKCVMAYWSYDAIFQLIQWLADRA